MCIYSYVCIYMYTTYSFFAQDLAMSPCDISKWYELAGAEGATPNDSVFVQVCTLQHTATHGNTLQHTATHCNTLQRIYNARTMYVVYCATPNKSHRNTLQHTAAHCNILQHTAAHCSTYTTHHTASHCCTLQHIHDSQTMYAL